MQISHIIIQLCYRLEESRRYRAIKDRVYDILENPRSPARSYFDLSMIALVVASVFLLIYEVRNDLGLFGDLFEVFVVTVFIVEYLLRFWVFNDSHRIILQHYERAQFLGTPFRLGPALGEVMRRKWDYVSSPLAIIDLLAIVPSYRPLRFLRIFLLFRLFKMFRYARSLSEFIRVLSEKRFELLTLAAFMAFLVFTAATAFYFFEAEARPDYPHTLFDGIYWALVTITTLGYGDIVPLTAEGRIVAMILIIAGMGVIAFFTSIIVSAFNEKMPEIRAQRVYAEVERRGDYTVLCGFGRVGQVVAERLAQDREHFVVVDSDSRKVDMAKKKGYLTIEGNAQDNELLARLGIDRKAKRVLSLTGDDVVNVYITLTARQMNPGVEIISRANHRENIVKMERAGANYTVAPYQMAGIVAAEYAGQPVAFEAISDMLSGEKGVGIDAIRVREGSVLSGRRMKEIPFKRYRLILFGVITGTPRDEIDGMRFYNLEDQQFIFNPGPAFRLETDDLLVVFGHEYSLSHFKQRIERGAV